MMCVLWQEKLWLYNNVAYHIFICGRLDLERDLEEYEREQQINAQYVEEFAMLTSEKVIECCFILTIMQFAKEEFIFTVYYKTRVL